MATNRSSFSESKKQFLSSQVDHQPSSLDKISSKLESFKNLKLPKEDYVDAKSSPRLIPERVRKTSLGPSHIPTLTFTNSNDSLHAKPGSSKSLSGSAPSKNSSPWLARKSPTVESPSVLKRRPVQSIPLFNPHDKEYYMTSDFNGLAVIFSHENFEDEAKRDGAELDVEALRKSLPLIGFSSKNIIVKRDLTKSQITNYLDDLSEKMPGSTDCLFVFVMTHGEEKDLLHAKDQPYPSQSIWAPFLGSSCSSLKGKPKVFFFVACRGSLTDPGTKLNPYVRRPSTTTDASTKKQATFSIPIQADILTVYSTQPLHYSFRESDRGTWYIEALCKEIQSLQNNETISLVDLLTDVNRRVAYTYDSYNDQDLSLHLKKQCSSFTSTLTRRMVLKVRTKT